TRLQGDWSSDVCSSDLIDKAAGCPRPEGRVGYVLQTPGVHGSDLLAVADRVRLRLVEAGGREVHVAGSAARPQDGVVHKTRKWRSEERRVGKGCQLWWW